MYPVKSKEPMNLVELWVKESSGKCEISEFTQEIPNEPQSNWQAPYDEKILDLEGEKIRADPWSETNENVKCAQKTGLL